MCDQSHWSVQWNEELLGRVGSIGGCWEVACLLGHSTPPDTPSPSPCLSSLQLLRAKPGRGSGPAEQLLREGSSPLTCPRRRDAMGCGGSKPATKKDYASTTSAASHRAARTKPGDQRSEFDIGPGYKAIRHLGTLGSALCWGAGQGRPAGAGRPYGGLRRRQLRHRRQRRQRCTFTPPPRPLTSSLVARLLHVCRAGGHRRHVAVQGHPQRAGRGS